jgi:hypothetical protein
MRLLGEAPDLEAELLEASPDRLFRAWAKRPLQRKTLPAGRRARWDLLRGFGIELPKGAEAITHDQLDAAACAFAAYQWATGALAAQGTPPVWDAAAECLRGGMVVG